MYRLAVKDKIVYITDNFKPVQKLKVFGIAVILFHIRHSLIKNKSCPVRHPRSGFYIICKVKINDTALPMRIDILSTKSYTIMI